MSKSTTILAAIAMLCATVMGSVWLHSRGVSPGRDPVPVVPTSFSDIIREAFNGDAAESCNMTAVFRAKQAVLRCDVEIKNTQKLFGIYKLGAEFDYGKGHEMASKYPAFYKSINEELRAKKLIPQHKSDGPIPVDRKGIIAVFDEVIRGLE